MKSVSRVAPSSRFAPYSPRLRPSQFSMRGGEVLRAASLAGHTALDKWLSKRVSSGFTTALDKDDYDYDSPVSFTQALCVLTLIKQEVPQEDLPIYDGPELFTVLLQIKLAGTRPSPYMRIARFEGSSQRLDGPLWTRILQPRQDYHIMETRSFAAQLAAGMSDIPVEAVGTMDISPRMRAWACTASLGTFVDADVVEHCHRLAVEEIRAANELLPEAERKRLPERRLVRRASPVKPRPKPRLNDEKENIDPRSLRC
ncbi:hypothetical protein FB45DRAFT_1025958 [Roridomyces roridus]|uniref:Uncharacterized protein n=1 Tax=Roridomyces roridus TaxID=1738132 RepID=A0AAD7FNY7_9AGAR|nr:hypothetical protein FB45DRAFT_1025958 [Roridomyces roridus]